MIGGYGQMTVWEPPEFLISRLDKRYWAMNNVPAAKNPRKEASWISIFLFQ